MISFSMSHFISNGTPGTLMMTPRGSSTRNAGAVPFGLRITVAPSGTVACFSLFLVRMKPRRAKPLIDLLQGLGIRDDLAIGDACHGLASEVVLRGPDAAGGDDDVGAFQCAVEDGGHAVEVVANGGLVEEVDAVLGEPLRYPRSVGVDYLAEQ